MLREGPWVPVIVAALIAGIAGGFVGRWSVSTNASASVPAAKEPPAESTQENAELAALERRVHALERAKASRQLPTPAAVNDDDSSQGARPAASDPAFQASVRDAMDQANEERRAQRNERTAARLGGALGLNDAQKEKAVGILADLSQAMRDLRDGSGDADAGSQTAADLRANADERFRALLDADQRAKYDALDPSEKLVPRRQRTP